MGKWCRQHRSGAKRDHVTTLINRLLRLTRTQHIIAQCRARVGCVVMLREGMVVASAQVGGAASRMFCGSQDRIFPCFLADRVPRRMDEMHCCMHLEARP